MNGDMTGQPGGVPRTGFMTMLSASHFETNQGRRLPNDPNGPRLLDVTSGGFGVGPRGDLVAVPSWCPVRLRARTQLDLLTFSDAPVYEALGLYRTEIVSGGEA